MSPLPSRRVRRKGAAPLSGSEEQTACAISGYAQYACLTSLQMVSMNKTKLDFQCMDSLCSQVKLILSPKQRAKPAASRTRTCTNAAVCIASGECPSRLTHKRTEERASVWGSEFTTKVAPPPNEIRRFFLGRTGRPQRFRY
jgi:hypothetical protein